MNNKLLSNPHLMVYCGLTCGAARFMFEHPSKILYEKYTLLNNILHEPDGDMENYYNTIFYDKLLELNN